MAQSRVRQNFHQDSEALINKQINMELYASYVYMAMASHFNRDDVALAGFSKFFKKNSEEEREHAQKLIDYQNMRGGRVVFQDVARPSKSEWATAEEAMLDALDLERKVNESLLSLHKSASKVEDANLTDFLEGNYLEEQVQAIKELGDMITQIKRLGDGVGLHIFDKELQDA